MLNQTVGDLLGSYGWHGQDGDLENVGTTVTVEDVEVPDGDASHLGAQLSHIGVV